MEGMNKSKKLVNTGSPKDLKVLCSDDDKLKLILTVSDILVLASPVFLSFITPDNLYLSRQSLFYISEGTSITFLVSNS